MRLFFLLILLTAMMGVIYYDGRWRRIPNFITFPLLAIGALSQYLSHGWSGVYLSMAGMTVGAGILLPVYLLGGLGGGDVKLAAAVGASVGVRLIGSVLFFTALSGGLLALWWIHRQNRALRWLPQTSLQEPALSDTLPYGWAIAIGTMLTLGIHPLEVWL
ncbi:hypothetical protein GX408_08885 [bacterium]|nr:hypothetical protein [bacterium]